MSIGIESPLSNETNTKLDENDQRRSLCVAAILVAGAAVSIFLLKHVPSHAVLLRIVGIVAISITALIACRKLCARFHDRADAIVGEDPE